jgi:hypothetical protein
MPGLELLESENRDAAVRQTPERHAAHRADPYHKNISDDWMAQSRTTPIGRRQELE